MNILKSLYCNQYYELKPKGKEASARTMGTRLLGICLSINFILLIVLLMIFIPDFADAFADSIKDVFGRKNGRALGKIVAVIPFLIFLPLVRYTLGTQKSYQSTINQFENQSKDSQRKISRRGLIFAIVSFASLFIATTLAMILLA